MTQNKSSVHDIIDRMKSVLNVTKDVELAGHIGGAKSQPAVWKKRGTVPLNACVALAIDRRVSLDWLVLGRGTRELGAGEQVIEQVEEGGDNVDVPAFDMPGLPSNVDEVRAWWSVPRAWLVGLGVSPDDAMVMRVLGDASFDSIGHGDIVLLDRRPRDSDGVFVLRINNQVRIKRVQLMSDGSVRLSSDHAAYEAEYIDAAAYAAIEVIGFCFASLGRVL